MNTASNNRYSALNCQISSILSKKINKSADFDSPITFFYKDNASDNHSHIRGFFSITASDNDYYVNKKHVSKLLSIYFLFVLIDPISLFNVLNIIVPHSYLQIGILQWFQRIKKCVVVWTQQSERYKKEDEESKTS